eukprot:TRINITY_DN537_c0_g1_i4.p1 TRINITY_DN537_c0_g1~~TRINITY_DN537_c0_g1_i4.p1  ORF type:complete len:459 (-),score=127.53 TRINITY_DN537_c0_g1_i4:40-1416(-)
MKVVFCLLLATYIQYTLAAASGGGSGDRKKRSLPYKHTYYGAAPTFQYEKHGFGMAGQKPYYSKMNYYDPLAGERYKAWLAGQAMYGEDFKSDKPVLKRGHWYLNYLLKNRMFSQYKALRTPSNDLWKMYGFSLYGNAGNGKYMTMKQKMRKKRSTYGGYDDYGKRGGGGNYYGYGHGGGGNYYGYGSGGGYDYGYGSKGGYDDYGYGGYGYNDYGKGDHYGYGKNYGYNRKGDDYGYGYGKYGGKGGDSYGYGYGKYGGKGGDSYGYGYHGGKGDSYGYGYYGGKGDDSYGYGSYGGNSYGVGKNDYGSYGYGSYKDGGSKYGYSGYGDTGYSSGGKGGYYDGGYGYGGGSYGGHSGGYSGGGHGGYKRKKRSLYQPRVHGVKGYYGNGFQALVKLARMGPYTWGGRWGWGGFPGAWGHTYHDFPWTGSMFYSKKFDYEAYNLANILEKYTNKPKYM